MKKLTVFCTVMILLLSSCAFGEVVGNNSFSLPEESDASPSAKRLDMIPSKEEPDITSALEEDNLTPLPEGNDAFSEPEFLKIAGKWEISAYYVTGLESHIDPVPEGYYKSEEEVKKHNEKYLNTVISISADTVEFYYPPSELGYYYHDDRDLISGFLIPISVVSPTFYIELEHTDFENWIDFIITGDGKSYIGIDHIFYEVTKVL